MALLALTTLATLAALLIVGGGLVLWRVPQIREENLVQVRREAHQLAERMEILLGSYQRQLELTGATLAHAPQSPSATLLDMLMAAGPSFEAVYLADRNGMVEAVSLGANLQANRDELLGSDLSANRLYRLALERKAAVWSNKFQSALSGNVTVGIAIPVGSRVLIGEVPLEELLRALHVAARDSRLLIWIIDRRGELVVETDTRSRLGPVNLLGLPLVRAALEGSPLPDTVTIQGGPFHPAVARSDRLEWLFLVRMPAGLNNPEVRSTALLVGAALLGSLLIGMLLAPFVADRISRPLRAITDRARQTADGAASGDWPRGPISEFNALAVDLETMANSLEERRDKLREAQRIRGDGELGMDGWQRLHDVV
ncbi:MAG: cache domain-containing protein [Comamonadaceae bacterium]|nr:cache domain-containing protein [Comamonadaceae bacterium]